MKTPFTKLLTLLAVGLGSLTVGCAPRSVEVRHITVAKTTTVRSKPAPKPAPAPVTPSNYPVVNSYDTQ